MSVLNQLASALNRRDEIPNQDLAKKIAETSDKVAIQELVDHLQNKDKNIQSDCIKTLDELSKLKPKLVAEHIHALLALLTNKNNRLQWGAMTAIHAVANENLAAIYRELPHIIACADRGSVITNDHCVGILVKLCAKKEYAEDAFILLNERLLKSPTNQLPMYAEMALPIINNVNRLTFIGTLSLRLPEIEKDTKRKRVEKILKKAST